MMILIMTKMTEIGGSRRGGGVTGVATPLSNFKNKESNKTKQKEDNPLETEEERKSCMFI